MKNKKIPKEISEHFASLGKKSWESRKAKLLEKLDKKDKVV